MPILVVLIIFFSALMVLHSFEFPSILSEVTLLLLQLITGAYFIPKLFRRSNN